MSDPCPCIKAYHEMEERYARMVLQYHNTEQRKMICDSIGTLIDKYHAAPLTTITPDENFHGEYSIEFHDDYDRESSDFFEDLIKLLNLDHCELG